VPGADIFATRARDERSASRLPSEIAFLENYGVSHDILAAAVERAARAGVSVEAALLAEGSVSEELFYRALADRLGAPYFRGGSAFATPDPHAAIVSGFVGLAAENELGRAVIAPSGPALEYLLRWREAGRPPAPVAICSRQRLGAMIRAQFGARIAREAADGLGGVDPSLTARTGLSRAQSAVVALLAAVAFLAMLLDPGLPRIVISILLWLAFAGGILLRSAATVAADSPPAAAARRDADLPVYTVIVAMYREGRVVEQLVRALDAIDYPRAKLDIKLVIEHGDVQTLAAIAALRLPPRYDVVVVPAGAPRTKPRALNVALAAARGELVVVFDAEDEPAPDQLRMAAARFAADPRVDALQARLTVSNPNDSWLSELFAIEYAVLFDLVNPGFAALDLPIALGGTSNHFRIHVLRRVGGWDAWNVTEDVDLGLRLARFGARVGALASDTAEEAPNEFGNWFRQRIRWQKGWMQTLIVHTRRPVRLFRELGVRRASSALLLIAVPAIGGLFGLPMFVDALWRALDEDFTAGGSFARAGDAITYILTLAGAQTIAIPALVAMRRRGMKGAGRALARMPIYYGLVCLATWAALFDLALRPFHWSKTEHGRVRRAAPSRRGDAAASLDAAIRPLR
jgi:hypothetical protein